MQVRLIITRAVRHLVIATVGNDGWRHYLVQLRLDIVYLDIYLFYVYILQCFEAVGWAAGRASGL